MKESHAIELIDLLLKGWVGIEIVWLSSRYAIKWDPEKPLISIPLDTDFRWYDEKTHYDTVPLEEGNRYYDTDGTRRGGCFEAVINFYW